MTLIALTGYARSGKDTTGQILVDHYGFERRAFGDVLKAIAEDTNPIIEVGKGNEFVETYRASVSELLECYGDWEQVKDHCPEARQYLVDLGNSMRKRIPGIEVFGALAGTKPGANVVLTNVYHPEEIAEIQSMGGKVIRVLRPGYGPANEDEANTAKAPVDATVYNDGSVEKLQVNLDLVLRYVNVPFRVVQGA